jgi:hypothetical protein
MNLSDNLTLFFDKTRLIYINLAIILGLIIIFIILPLPIPKYISNISKFIILFSLLYLAIENFKTTFDLINNINSKDDEKIIKNTFLLSNIVNILIIILIIYIWYIIVF